MHPRPHPRTSASPRLCGRLYTRKPKASFHAVARHLPSREWARGGSLAEARRRGDMGHQPRRLHALPWIRPHAPKTSRDDTMADHRWYQPGCQARSLRRANPRPLPAPGLRNRLRRGNAPRSGTSPGRFPFSAFWLGPRARSKHDPEAPVRVPVARVPVVPASRPAVHCRVVPASAAQHATLASIRERPPAVLARSGAGRKCPLASPTQTTRLAVAGTPPRCIRPQ